MRYKRIVICLCGLISAFWLISCGNNEVNTNEKDDAVETTESIVAEGADTLGGTWYVGATYYKNNLIDIKDVDALEDLYDSVFLTFNEDGSFIYTNRYNYKGEYTKYEQTEYDSYLLKTKSLSIYDLENGEIVEKEVESDTLKTFLIVLLDEENTFEFSEYDSISGKAKADSEPLIFVKDTSNEYIDENKAVIKGDNKEADNSQNNNNKNDYIQPSISNNNENVSFGKRNALERALDLR